MSPLLRQGLAQANGRHEITCKDTEPEDSINKKFWSDQTYRLPSNATDPGAAAENHTAVSTVPRRAVQSEETS